MSKYAAWDVYLKSKHVDTVFTDGDLTKDEVYTSLVNHDGYNPAIVVQKARD